MCAIFESESIHEKEKGTRREEKSREKREDGRKSRYEEEVVERTEECKQGKWWKRRIWLEERKERKGKKQKIQWKEREGIKK